MMLVTTFPYQKRKLNVQSYDLQVIQLHYVLRSDIKDEGNKSLQNACIHVPESKVP
jgi:hypothetical protein